MARHEAPARPPARTRGGGGVVCSGLAYAHPGGDLLFTDVSFTIAAGAHVGVVGVNGVGKSTLFRIMAGELEPDDGRVAVSGRLAYMPQAVGAEAATVREMLVAFAPRALRTAGERMAAAELALAGGDHGAGVDLGAAIADWSEHGGYELEAQWDRAARRIVRSSFEEIAERPAATLSGGERKTLALEVLFESDADVLLLDEPDNFLDVRGKQELERRIAASPKTVLVISHDRDLLTAATSAILTLEGEGCWLHGGSYATYPEAREARQQRLGDAVKRWHEEERRLYRLVKTFKERARYAPDWAKKANAAESRWRRFAAPGPPPKPVSDQRIGVRMRGGDSARRVLVLEDVAIDGLIRPFSDEIHFGERVGVIGPNGSGKTHLMRLLAGEASPSAGRVTTGPRVSTGYFTQLNARDDLRGAETILDTVVERVNGDVERAMGALARYRLADAARRDYDTMSGGQKARLEILCLELEGHNLLLLDEPTDNLDIDSAEALESALDGFEGTVVAVTHDRTFLKRLDRYVLVPHSGDIRQLPDHRSALEALTGSPER
ncbi:MAG TPA: ATP-binding cassette domain-containing protein [Solirubrobacteraceae bacterium]|nr:ATP-binding cassette domain-containing protein [Solirubrobacteraceae bacterium]